MLTLIKKRTVFPHPIGIVVGKGVVIGENCTIYQNVTIGSKNNYYPIIGNNVVIYPNSVILGKIRIGDNAVVGANSLILKDVESNSVCYGVYK